MEHSPSHRKTKDIVQGVEHRKRETAQIDAVTVQELIKDFVVSKDVTSLSVRVLPRMGPWFFFDILALGATNFGQGWHSSLPI